MRLFNKPKIPIRMSTEGNHTVVDNHWADYTVINRRLKSCNSAKKSADYIDWRFSVYPASIELWDDVYLKDDEIVLDYGCGPGTDMVAFFLNSNPQKVIGIDISLKALKFASKRLSMHGITSDKVELIRISDSDNSIPLADKSIDFIYSVGVLQHTSNPSAILGEFHRILKDDGNIWVMVYNRNSIIFHLKVAYRDRILNGRLANLSIEEAFSKSTDSTDTPISRCYCSSEFADMTSAVKLESTFLGGYFCPSELETLRDYGQQALKDSRLGDEHREFLQSLTYDNRGYPLYQGKLAGIGGLYKMSKVLVDNE